MKLLLYSYATKCSVAQLYDNLKQVYCLLQLGFKFPKAFECSVTQFASLPSLTIIRHYTLAYSLHYASNFKSLYENLIKIFSKSKASFIWASGTTLFMFLNSKFAH